MVSSTPVRPAATATTATSSPAMKRGLSRHPRLAAATLALTLTAVTVQQLSSSRARENESARKKNGDLFVTVDRSGGGI
ncbi:hypothetical protein QBC40DRAFT_267799 [Triangularia verruculosa]|uniref:Uncharacterized protein n=1 Tax=Triangularia verruculosa TaxID=2587418 RepID=A0AAN6XD69_9PEZI|nr:hypothetical protein QBC40DRAFT_267799 [Triangularia verruculosa]